jgi:DNA polymerase III epsilon subunit-like protein
MEIKLIIKIFLISIAQILITNDLKSHLELNKMKVLIFDTETTGLPKSKIISQDTLDKWPHIVQFSFIIFDTTTESFEVTKDFVIKMEEGTIISEESIALHEITNEISREKGVDIQAALHLFFYYLRSVDLLVGHNVSFDINMIYVELLRIIYLKQYPEEHISAYKSDLHLLTNFKNIYCTMQESIDLCAIKVKDKFGREYNKFPKLVELHLYLFQTKPNGLHNSLIDILITLRCFMHLKYNKDLLTDCKDFIEATKQINFV